MSCSGLHCAGCGAGAAAPPAALAVFAGAAWVAAHLAEVAVMSAACAALAVAVVVALIRRQDRRQDAVMARGSLAITRPDALPPPPRRALAPVVNNYYVIADTAMAAAMQPQPWPQREPAPVIRGEVER